MIRGRNYCGERVHIGPNVKITANNVHIGDDVYISGDLVIGGGGSMGPNANLHIGDRCTLHNNFINVCEPVFIGNDVGLSHNVALITHGYWQSVLEGYPAKFAPVEIGDGVILGYNAVVLPGVTIGKNTVVGAGSVISKSIGGGIWAGNPVKKIRDIEPLTLTEKIRDFNSIIEKYKEHAAYQGVTYRLEYEYPWIQINDFTLSVDTFGYFGEEDETTDHFRDFLRHYGIRIYTKRPFG